jgi:DNA-binding transcriptional LysR family regulator
MEDILALRLFLAIAEAGGFARAARRLGLTPAAATRKVAALEAELGMRLFQRSTRRVSLTEQGEHLRAHAQRILDSVDEARDALRGTRTRPAGRLRVMCRAGLGRHFIVPHLPAFRARYPEIAVGLELNDSGLLDIVAHGCDVAVSIGHLADSSLVAKRLAETDSQIYVSPAYLAVHGTPGTPAALAEHACLTMAAESGTTTWHFSAGATRYAVPIRAAVAVNDADALMSCARAGLGFIMVADWFARDDVVQGSLVPVLEAFQVEPRGTPINLLYPSRSFLPSKVRAFADFYAECARRRFALPAQAEG